MVLKSTKEAFTLIEVIISVLIISIVGTALLEISNKNTKILSFLNLKREVPTALSVVAYHGNKDINNLEKTLLDIVDNDYKIESDRLKKYLEKKKILYKEESFDRVDFGQNENNESENDNSFIQVEIYRKIIKNENLVGSIYSLKVEN